MEIEIWMAFMLGFGFGAGIVFTAALVCLNAAIGDK